MAWKYEVNPFSLPVLLTACFLAANAEKWKRFSQAVQIGAFLLPVIPFLMETNIWGKLSVLLPWIYFVVTVLRRGYDISYRRFRKTYLAFFWIYIALFSFFLAEDFTKGQVAMLTAGPFMLILLVSGIFFYADIAL